MAARSRRPRRRYSEHGGLRPSTRNIRANKIRSLFLLAGLFLLVYVLVYAGALVAEAYLHGNYPLEVILWRAKRDFVQFDSFRQPSARSCGS